MQRACAAALLHKGTTIISNPGSSDDNIASLNIVSTLGAKWEMENGKLKIESKGVDPAFNTINCGESGLAIRMFTPIVALSEQLISITGSGSLSKRPMNFFDEVLPQLGVEIRSNSGKLPIEIKGPLQPKNITVDGSLSSQFLTGLLMAYSAAGANDISIKVNDLKSKPYVDLTMQVMKEFGMKVPENKNYEEFYFGTTANRRLTTTVNYIVEGDWSGAAFLLVAGAISGNIEVKGLDPFSAQADKKILEALMSSGAGLSIEPDKIEVRSHALKAFHFNATDCPDLFPPLVALASYCEGTSVIEGVSRLAYKESERSVTLQEEFGKMEINIKLQDDLMIVEGGKVSGATVHSRHDHRIAMACATAALKATGSVTIEHAEAVNKSYHEFFEDLKKLGAGVSLIN